MDQYKLWLGLICFLSVVLCIFLCTANVSHDFFFHFNWMKITHRVPIQNWYNQKGHYLLDYPPLTAYIHYLMGIVYNIIDPNALFETELNAKKILVTSGIKYTTRFVIFLNTIIFFYPAVICCVNYMCRRYSNSVKLLVIAILINMPIYVKIEHMNTQVNAPTLAFLLFSILFMFKGYYSLTAIFFGLSIMSKQITLYCIFPIGFYILSNLRKYAEIKEKPVFFYIISQCIKLLLIGTATILILLIPFLFYPESLIDIKNQCFPVGRCDWICPTGNIWMLFRSLLYPFDTPENQSLIFRICSAIVIITDFITLPFIWRSPRSKKLFWTIFTICGMNLYLFGFDVHEKHLQYTYIGFVFGFIFFKKFLCSFSTSVSYSLIYHAFIYDNIFLFYIMNIIFIPLIYLFQRNIPEIPPQENAICGIRLYNFQNRYSSLFLKVVFSTIIFFSLIRNIWIYFSSREFYETYLHIDFTFVPTFFIFLYVYIFMWASLCAQSYNLEHKIHAIPYQQLLIGWKSGWGFKIGFILFIKN